MGPWKLWAKPGSVGRVPTRAVFAWALGGAATLLGVHVLTGSEGAQALALLAVVIPWRALQARAARTTPLPAYPDPPPPAWPAWQRYGILLLASAALGLAIGELAYRAGGGVFLWCFAVGVVPLAAYVNRHGVTRRA